MVYKWLSNIQQIFYPYRCVLCGQPGSDGIDLCRGCRSALPRNRHACLRCGSPLGQAGSICGSCLRHPPPYLSCHIPFFYASPLDFLLQQLKFHQQLHLASLLGELMVEGVKGRAGALPDCLVPVPLHAGRLRERGYNQALELGRVLSRRLGVPLDSGLCKRQRATVPQTSLDGDERRKNLRGAFVVRHGIVPRHIALIDDVVTTGTTVSELATRLAHAGVEVIEVWACARAGRNR